MEIYLEDSYLKELQAKVIEINDNKIILDKTIFYPTGGGQPCDKGLIEFNDKKFNVIDVKKNEGKIVHEIEINNEINFKENDIVNCKIDWERRYTLMKYHTATHILCSVFNKETGALITGNKIDIEKTRIDFNLENFDRDKINNFADKANEIISNNIDIETYFMDKEEAMKIDNITKLAKSLPENIKKLRIVKIGDVDLQADAGTHVKNTKEIGKIEIIKAENKGKNNRRVYFKLI